MDRNPYSPPQATVRDNAEPDTAGPRPTQVTVAVRLFWIEFALSVMQGGWYWYEAPDRLSAYSVVIGSLLALPLEAWIIVKIARRRNWARFVALGAVVISGVLWFGSIRKDFLADPVSGIMGSVELGMDGVALFLLFANQGKQWFK